MNSGTTEKCDDIQQLTPPNRYSQVLKYTCERPVMHAQTWACYSAVYQFPSLSSLCDSRMVRS